MTKRWYFLAPYGVLLALICLFIFTNTLGNDFVSDDLTTIEQNELVTSPKSWTDVFSQPFPNAKEGMTYRPLTNLLSLWDHVVWKLDPYGYHLTNIILHIFCTILALWLFSLLLRDPEDGPVILLAGALFACHPVHVEAVSWISGRSELLAAFWLMLSLIFYIKFRILVPLGSKAFKMKGLLWLLATMVCYFLALLSKESGATLILLIPLYDILLAPRAEEKSLKSFFVRDLVFPYVLFIIVFGVYLAIRFSVLTHVALPGQFTDVFIFNQLPIYSKFLTVLKVFAKYLLLLVVPANLCFTHLLGFSKSIFDPIALVSAAAILFTIGLAIILRKRAPYISFGIFWIFLTLLPVSHIVPIGVFMGERFLYIPSIGFCLAAAYLIALLWRINLSSRMALITHIAIAIFVVSILFIFTIRTVERNSVWRNHYTLFSDVIKKYPFSYRGHVGLASYYEEQGLLEDARRHYAIGLKITGPSPHIALALSKVEVKMGNLANAVIVLQQALRYHPEDKRLHHNLAVIYRAMGEDELAEQHEKFIKKDSL